MAAFLEEKNIILSYNVIKRLKDYKITFENIKGEEILFFKKDLDHPMFSAILLKPEWLTFALCLKDKYHKDIDKDNAEKKAKEILNCEEFDKYNLTQVKDGLQYDKWVYRNFYYPSDDWCSLNKLCDGIVEAFRKLEELVQKSKASAVNPCNDASKN